MIERRLLVNFRADPEVVARLLPAPFEPQLVAGTSLVGMCLIRLRGVRPSGFPSWVGVTSENVAHRVAVELRRDDAPAFGVYVPRRDTSSRIALAGSRRFFPGGLHLAHFAVAEAGGRYRVEVASRDRETNIVVDGDVATTMPPDSVFATLADASRFFEQGAVGYSDGPCEGTYDGVQLSTTTWSMAPLHVHEARSSFFEDSSRFPQGSVVFDSALVMVGIESQWHALEPAEGTARAA